MSEVRLALRPTCNWHFLDQVGKQPEALRQAPQCVHREVEEAAVSLWSLLPRIDVSFRKRWESHPRSSPAVGALRGYPASSDSNFIRRFSMKSKWVAIALPAASGSWALNAATICL